MLGIINNNQYLITLLVAAIGVIPPLLTLAIGIYNTSRSRKEELNNRQYTQYHQLIYDLASNVKKFAEPQTAMIYELRFYRKYRHVTIRILSELKETWEQRASQDTKLQRKEIELAINILKKNPLSWRLYRIKEKFIKAH